MSTPLFLSYLCLTYFALLVSGEGRCELDTSQQIKIKEVLNRRSVSVVSAGASGKMKNGKDDNREDNNNDDNKKTTTDNDFQQRNVGDLTSRKLEKEKKYNPFCVVAQPIAKNKKTEAETRKPSFVLIFVPPSALKKGGGSNLSATSSAAVDIGRQLFEAKGRSLG